MSFRKRYYVYIIRHKRIVQVDTGQIREHNHPTDEPPEFWITLNHAESEIQPSQPNTSTKTWLEHT